MCQVKLTYGSKPVVRPCDQLPDNAYLSKVMPCSSQESRVSDDSANSSFYLPCAHSSLQKIIPEGDEKNGQLPSNKEEYWRDDGIPGLDDCNEYWWDESSDIKAGKDNPNYFLDISDLPELSQRDMAIFTLFLLGGCDSNEALNFYYLPNLAIPKFV